MSPILSLVKGDFVRGLAVAMITAVLQVAYQKKMENQLAYLKLTFYYHF
jgi:hypothetical protein